MLPSLGLLGFPWITGGSRDVFSTILIYWSLNKLANFVLSVTKSSITFIEILSLVRKPLLVRNGLTVFEDFF